MVRLRAALAAACWYVLAAACSGAQNFSLNSLATQYSLASSAISCRRWLQFGMCSLHYDDTTDLWLLTHASGAAYTLQPCYGRRILSTENALHEPEE